MGFGLVGRLHSILCVALAAVAVAACCTTVSRADSLVERVLLILFQAIIMPLPLLSCEHYTFLGCKRLPDLLV